MATIGGITVNVRANTRQFAKGMKRVRTMINTTGKALVRFGAIAGGIAFAALAAGVRNAAKEIDNFQKKARSLGESATSFINLSRAAEFSGVKTDTLIKGMQKFSAVVGDTLLNKTATGIRAFEALGTSAEELDKLDMQGKIAKIQEGLSRLSQSEQSSVLKLLFGRSGIDLQNLFSLTREQMAAIATESEALGLTFTDSQGRAVEQMNDNMSRLGDVFTGIFRQFTVMIAPAVVRITEGIIQWAVQTRGAFTAAKFLLDIFLTMADVVDAIVLGIKGVGAGIVFLMSRAEVLTGVNKQQGDQAIADFQKALVADSPSRAFNRMMAEINNAPPVDFGLGLVELPKVDEAIAASVSKTITQSANTALTFGSTAASSFLNRQNANNFQKKQEKFQQDNLAGLDRVVNAVDRLQPVHVAFL